VLCGARGLTASSTAAGIAIFGVRHLSPGAAWHVRETLEKLRPKCVLIEGPSDLTPLAHHLVDKRCRPPVAALAYTTTTPVDTILYPLATYSPEFQALVWAKERRADARFIDLPSGVFLALQAKRKQRYLAQLARRIEGESESGATAPEPVEADESGPEYERICRHIADLCGEEDYDSYWEGRFETIGDAQARREALNELGATLRSLSPDTGEELAETLIREAHMRRAILAALTDGYAVDDLLVVAGAYHAPVLGLEHGAMTDDELASLPCAPSNFTLMPYSYQRLATRSGYGAGNNAPAYFEMKWDCMRRGAAQEFPAQYLASLARHLREAGTFRSTAEVIEGARLARALASMREREEPVRGELRSAAVTLLGQGEFAGVKDALEAVEVGTAIGSLPPGVAQTSIQDDVQRELRRLKLEKYYQGIAEELDLDLREDRRAKSAEAAFLDLARSTFLHRLAAIQSPFAMKQRVSQDAATWSERWKLKWSPEAEIAIVEAVLLGETVELAASFALARRLDAATTVCDAASVIRDAGECSLPATMAQARLTLANLGATTSSFADLANAAAELAATARYGDVRRFDAAPLLPLIEQLFRVAALQLHGAAACDNAAAATNILAIHALNTVCLEFHDMVDEGLWEAELRRLSNSDAHNPMMSGYCCGLLLERGLIGDEELSVELARRLSPGIDADLGAGWFEGLSKRNRHALLSRLSLWRHLEEYIATLDDEQFKRAVVFLRRSFESFTDHDRRRVAENLGEIWDINSDRAAHMIERALDDDEKKTLDDLNAIDFGDL